MQHHVSTCFKPQMRDMASNVDNKAGKGTCVKEAACTLSGTAFPLAIVMGVAAMGTSPCAEMKIEVAPVCGMVGLSRSNLTTVADVDGTVCPGATDKTSVPLLAAQAAVELKTAPVSSSLILLSGVTDPSNPEMVTTALAVPVRSN